MRRQIRITTAVALAFALTSHDARADKAKDTEIAAAAAAIFGDGLSVKRNGNKTIVDWGELDEKTARHYLATYWAPALERIDPENVFSAGSNRRVFPFYTKPLRRTKRAYFLMEPDGRRELCIEVAKSIADEKLKKATTGHCTVRAVETANKPVLGFRGESVSYDTGAAYAGVWFKDKLWANTDGTPELLLVAPGPDDVDQIHQLTYVHNVAFIGRTMRDEFSTNALRALRRQLDAANDKLAKTKALVAARDRKLVGKKATVLFTDHPADGWAPIKVLGKKARPSCYAAQVHSYGPGKPKPGQLFTFTVSLNGRTCKTRQVGHQNRLVREHQALWEYCMGRDKYDVGENRVEVTIAYDVRQHNGKETSKNKGKVAAKGTLRCKAR